MFDASNKLEKIKTTSDPLWLLTLWVGIYFSSICQYHEFEWENSQTPSTYGAVMIAMFDKVVVPLSEIIAYLASGERIDLWHPCSAKDRLNSISGPSKGCLNIASLNGSMTFRLLPPKIIWHTGIAFWGNGICSGMAPKPRV